MKWLSRQVCATMGRVNCSIKWQQRTSRFWDLRSLGHIFTTRQTNHKQWWQRFNHHWECIRKGAAAASTGTANSLSMGYIVCRGPNSIDDRCGMTKKVSFCKHLEKFGRRSKRKLLLDAVGMTRLILYLMT